MHAIEDPNHPLNKCKYPWDYELNVVMGWDEQNTLQISDMFKADAVLHEVTVRPSFTICSANATTY